MEGEDISDEELARANKLLREERAGKGEDGVFEGSASLSEKR
jgi:hypothetical protein